MTFDEALDELEPRTIWSGEMRDLLEQLRETYAPAVEMTKNQKNAFDEAKRVLNTRDLASNFGQEWTILDEVSGKVFGHGQGKATNEQIEAIMQAWLHPETIKVVDNDV